MITFCIVATIVVYLAAMLFVGFAYSKSNEDSADFYLGGRKMGPLVTAMSAEASDMSSWLYRPELYVPGGLSLVMKVYFSSPSGKMILLTKKKITMEMPPLRMVVPML